MKFIDILEKLIALKKEPHEAKSFEKQLNLLCREVTQDEGLTTEYKESINKLIEKIAHSSSELSLKEVLLPYAKLAYIFEQTGNAEGHAEKLASLFETKEDVFS